MKDREAGMKKSKIIHNILWFRDEDRNERKYYEREGGQKAARQDKVRVVCDPTLWRLSQEDCLFMHRLASACDLPQEGSDWLACVRPRI